jgi:hypothetical protein
MGTAESVNDSDAVNCKLCVNRPDDVKVNEAAKDNEAVKDNEAANGDDDVNKEDAETSRVACNASDSQRPRLPSSGCDPAKITSEESSNESDSDRWPLTPRADVIRDMTVLGKTSVRAFSLGLAMRSLSAPYEERGKC